MMHRRGVWLSIMFAGALGLLAGCGDDDAGAPISPPDTTAPSVSSIVRVAASPTNAASVDFTVTFDEAVTGVDTADFALTTSGTTGNVASVATVSASVYTVTVSTITGDGTLRLDLTDDNSIEDLSANLLGGVALGDGNFTTGEDYTIDNTAPNVSSIVRVGASPTNAASVDFTVTFDSSVTGVGTSDFALTESGTTGNVASVTPVSGSIYTVTVDTITGDGTIRLDLSDDDSIQDLSTNPLGGAGAGNGDFTSGAEYAIDNTGPNVLSIVRVDATPTSAASVDFTVTFDDSVTGLDTVDFTLTVSGTTGNVASVTPVSADVYTVTVDTITGDGTLRLDVADDDSVTDAVGNPLGGTGTGNGDFTAGESYTIDRVGPTVISTSPVDAASSVEVSSLIIVDFDEPMDSASVTTVGSVTVFDSTNSQPVTGDVTYSTIDEAATFTPEAPMQTSASHDVTVATTVTDVLGNAMAATYTFSFTTSAAGDTTDPSVTSIIRASADPTNAASVEFTVAFDEAVTGVNTNDFAAVQVTGTAAGNVASVTSVSASVYTVTVSGISGDGTLRLNLMDDDSIQDLSANVLGGAGAQNFITGQVYTIDNTGPDVSSIALASADPTNAASVDFTVTFDSSVTGVGTVDFGLSGTATAGASVSNVAGAGAAYTVTVSGISGDGTLRLDVADDDSITDALGNPFGGAGVQDYTSGPAYTIDNTAPGISSIVRADASPTNAVSVDFTVTFDSSVTGVGTVDFGLFGTATAGAGVSNVAGSGAVYTVTVSGISGDGTLRLDVTDDDSIADAATNPFGGAGVQDYTSGPSYTIDNTAPGVSSIVRVGASPTNAASVDFTVTFDSSVTGVGTVDFGLSGTATAGAGVSNVAGSGAVYTVTVIGISGDGTLQLDVTDDDSILDLATNPLGGAGSGNGDFTTGEFYTIDNTGPSVFSITRLDLDPTNAVSVEFSVLFNDSVTGVNTSDFAVGVTATAAGSVASVVDLDGTEYTVTVDAITGDGTITLLLADDDTITDAVGNPLGGAGAGNGDFTTGELYTIDNTGPSVFSITRLDPDPTNAVSVAFSVLFNDSVTGVDTSDFAVGVTATAAGSVASVVDLDGTEYTVTVDAITGNGTITLLLADDDSITDAVGNPLGGAGAGNGDFTTGEFYTIDNTGPSVSSITRLDSDPTNAASVEFSVLFNDSVAGVNTSDFAVGVTGTAAGSVASVVDLDGTQYTVTVDTITGDGTIRLLLADDDTITDAVGNPLGGAGAGNGDFTTGEFYAVDRIPPNVWWIILGDASPTNATSVAFTVMFDESVTGVDTNDFDVWPTATAVGNVASVAAVSASEYAVTVDTVGGDGTLRLDVVDDNSIIDALGNAFGGAGFEDYTSGPAYTIDNTPPAPPVITSPTIGAIVGTTPTVIGTAEALSTVEAFSSVNGSMGTTSADAFDDWQLVSGTVLDGTPHTLTATATDAAGNTSAPSTGVNVTVDATAPWVVRFQPEPTWPEVNPTESVVIQFSEEMDVSSVEAAFSLTPAPAGYIFFWSSSAVTNDTVTIIPDVDNDGVVDNNDLLLDGTAYTFDLDNGIAADFVGNLLDAPFSEIFATRETTPPMLLAGLVTANDSSTSDFLQVPVPEDSVEDGDTIVFTFDEAMDMTRGSVRVQERWDQFLEVRLDSIEIMNVTPDGTDVVYTTSRDHGLVVGATVDVVYMDPPGYDLNGAVVTSATFNTFTVANTESTLPVDNWGWLVVSQGMNGSLRWTAPNELTLTLSNVSLQAGKEYVIWMQDVRDASENWPDLGDLILQVGNNQSDDQIAPTVIFTSPPDGATDVPRASPISIEFSESIAIDTLLEISIWQDTTDITSSFDMVYEMDGMAEVEFIPMAELDASVTIDVDIPATVTDLAGRGVSPVVFSYVTAGDVDGTKPTVIATSPQDGEDAAAPRHDISIQFSEALDLSSIDAGDFLVENLTDSTVVRGWDFQAKPGDTVVSLWNPNGPGLEASMSSGIAVNYAVAVGAGSNQVDYVTVSPHSLDVGDIGIEVRVDGMNLGLFDGDFNTYSNATLVDVPDANTLTVQWASWDWAPDSPETCEAIVGAEVVASDEIEYETAVDHNLTPFTDWVQVNEMAPGDQGGDLNTGGLREVVASADSRHFTLQFLGASFTVGETALPWPPNGRISWRVPTLYQVTVAEDTVTGISDRAATPNWMDTYSFSFTVLPDIYNTTPFLGDLDIEFRSTTTPDFMSLSLWMQAQDADSGQFGIDSAEGIGGDIVTYTCSQPHGLVTSQLVQVMGSGGFDTPYGEWLPVTVPTDTTFEVTWPGAPVGGPNPGGEVQWSDPLTVTIADARVGVPYDDNVTVLTAQDMQSWGWGRWQIQLGSEGMPEEATPSWLIAAEFPSGYYDFDITIDDGTNSVTYTRNLWVWDTGDVPGPWMVNGADITSNTEPTLILNDTPTLDWTPGDQVNTDTLGLFLMDLAGTDEEPLMFPLDVTDVQYQIPAGILQPGIYAWIVLQEKMDPATFDEMAEGFSTGFGPEMAKSMLVYGPDNDLIVNEPYGFSQTGIMVDEWSGQVEVMWSRYGEGAFDSVSEMYFYHYTIDNYNEGTLNPVSAVPGALGGVDYTYVNHGLTDGALAQVAGMSDGNFDTPAGEWLEVFVLDLDTFWLTWPGEPAAGSATGGTVDWHGPFGGMGRDMYAYEDPTGTFALTQSLGDEGMLMDKGYMGRRTVGNGDGEFFILAGGSERDPSNIIAGSRRFATTGFTIDSLGTVPSPVTWTFVMSGYEVSGGNFDDLRIETGEMVAKSGTATVIMSQGTFDISYDVADDGNMNLDGFVSGYIGGSAGNEIIPLAGDDDPTGPEFFLIARKATGLVTSSTVVSINAVAAQGFGVVRYTTVSPHNITDDQIVQVLGTGVTDAITVDTAVAFGGGWVTYTTVGDHGLMSGMLVSVSGCADGSFDTPAGERLVVDVWSQTNFGLRWGSAPGAGGTTGGNVSVYGFDTPAGSYLEATYISSTQFEIAWPTAPGSGTVGPGGIVTVFDEDISGFSGLYNWVSLGAWGNSPYADYGTCDLDGSGGLTHTSLGWGGTYTGRYHVADGKFLAFVDVPEAPAGQVSFVLSVGPDTDTMFGTTDPNTQGSKELIILTK